MINFLNCITMRQIKIYMILFILLSQAALAQWTFSEVMYDPIGSDSNREWVEIIGPPLNDNISFIEGGTSHKINLISGNCSSNNCINIIADDAVLFLREWDISPTTLLYDSSWSSLKNTGEDIGLKNGDLIEISFSYPAVASAPNSLQLENNTWVSKLPSPGINNLNSTNVNSTSLNSTNENIIVQVPEFNVILASIMLCIIGLFIYIKREQN